MNNICQVDFLPPHSLGKQGLSEEEEKIKTSTIITDLSEKGNQLILLALSGVPGGGKSTYSTKEAQALNQHCVSFLKISDQYGTNTALEVDKLMSVRRGQEKISLLSDHPIQYIRENFFRTQIFQDLVSAVGNNKEFFCTEAYTGHTLDGEFTASLEKKVENGHPSIIITEGVFADEVAEKSKFSSVSNLFYPDIALSLLNTVQRGVENPDRRKNPQDAFLEFLRFNKILIGSFEQTHDSFDVIITPEKLNDIFKQKLFTFLA